MHINSVSEAIAAGLIKKAADNVEVGAFDVGDLVHSGKDVYRIIGMYPKLPGGEKLLLVKRTKDERNCVGFAPSQKRASEVCRMVADITAIVGPTRIKRVTVHRFGGYINPDGTVVQEGQSYMYEWKWVSSPAEASEFVLHGNHRYMGYELQAAYVQLGMGFAIIPHTTVKDGVPAV